MTHLVKIKLNGDLRIMEIPSPPFFAALVDAVSEAYALPAGNKEELTFTYKDADGDEVCPQAGDQSPARDTSR